MNTSEILDRIERAKLEAIPGRLLNGAEILGKLWKSGPEHRCASSWSASCACPVRKSFCIGKLKWLGLLTDYATIDARATEAILKNDPADPHYLINLMRVREFLISMITIHVAPPVPGSAKDKHGVMTELAPIPIGPIVAGNIDNTWPTLYSDGDTFWPWGKLQELRVWEVLTRTENFRQDAWVVVQKMQEWMFPIGMPTKRVEKS